jgi:hypothetical protein
MAERARWAFQRLLTVSPRKLPDQASLTKEFVLSQDCDNGFLAFLGYDSDFDLSRLNIVDRIRSIALRKDDLLLWMRGNSTAPGCCF